MFKKNKRGIFGLNSVQQFFVIILSVALLAYIIVIVMGVLGGTTILDSFSATVTNETGGYINETGYTLDQASEDGFSSVSITQISNSTSGQVLLSGNYTISATGVLTNSSITTWGAVNITYAYSYNSNYQNDLNDILEDTSTGVTGFFSSISPIYAILAVLVIILVLAVLVRVVSTPGGGEKQVQLWI